MGYFSNLWNDSKIKVYSQDWNEICGLVNVLWQISSVAFKEDIKKYYFRAKDLYGEVFKYSRSPNISYDNSVTANELLTSIKELIDVYYDDYE